MSRVRVEGELGASRVQVETCTRDVGCDVYRMYSYKADCELTYITRR